MRSSLETGALLNGALSRYLRSDCGGKSVMSVRGKCDEKESRQRSAVSRQVVQLGVGGLAGPFSKSARSGAPPAISVKVRQQTRVILPR